MSEEETNIEITVTQECSPFELERGIYITILEHIEDQAAPPSPLGGLFGGAPSKPTWGIGMVFRIVEIDHPFIAVKTQQEDTPRMVLDTRKMKLKELSNEFVNAVLNGREL